jgi:hypothetical protein
MPEEKLKYLEFLQSVISRMAANSFLTKAWSVTLGTAVLGFSVKESSWALSLIAAVPIVSFWLLDAYYLGLEKLFRDLWNDATKAEQANFNMNPGLLTWQRWSEAALRPAVWLVHLPVFIVSILAAFILLAAHPNK